VVRNGWLESTANNIQHRTIYLLAIEEMLGRSFDRGQAVDDELTRTLKSCITIATVAFESLFDAA